MSFLVGENGSGKSTLLEAIARRAGLHFNPRMSRIPEYVKPNEEHLYSYSRLTWNNGTVPGAFFSAENFREFAEFLDDASATDPGLLKYFGGQKITVLSHGEGHPLVLQRALSHPRPLLPGRARGGALLRPARLACCVCSILCGTTDLRSS